MSDRLAWLFLIVSIAGLTLFALHWTWFAALPTFVASGKTRSPRTRRYLEFVVATPSLIGDRFKVPARFELMRLCILEGRADRLVEQGFAILRHAITPNLETEVRWRLADGLETLGRRDEAEEQRRRAAAVQHEGPLDATWFVNRGRLLEAEHAFAAACEAYETGLKAVPPDNFAGRRLLLAHLMTAYSMAGKTEDSVRCAEGLLELNPPPEQQVMAHRMAGTTLNNLGRFDEAEAHKRRAAELAADLGDAAKHAEILADLAETHRKRGRLAEALRTCDEAEAAALGPVRHIHTVRYEVLKSCGRFDEALNSLKAAISAPPLAIVRRERFVQGVFSWGMAATLLEMGETRGVEELLESARADTSGDEKLTLWCLGVEARLSALLGRHDDYLRATEAAENLLIRFLQDRNTTIGLRGALGRAALAAGDPETALAHWKEYLGLGPDPVDRPTALYYLGECHRALGHPDAARASYREAAATGLDTHYARLARSRSRSLLD